MLINVREILALAVEQKVSDVHFTVGVPPIFRVRGELVRLAVGKGAGGGVDQDQLSSADMEKVIQQIMTEKQLRHLKEIGECDFAHAVSGIGRFRVNVFRQRGSSAVAIRVLSSKIPSIKELGLPEVAYTLGRKPNGLVLVTGPTGSGKTTTLAAMVDQINSERRCHILTLEDPIEYLYQHRRSIVNQREIGDDSGSFASALRAALREDPDVILVGEMRDLETTAISLTAAETGHLVLATMHTPSAALTVERIIDVFPPHQQGQIRVLLAGTLQGVLAQRLLQRADGEGRVLAAEVLIATPAARNLIREGKSHQLLSVIQTGQRYGMQTFDQCLKTLYTHGVISQKEMVSAANDAESVQKNLGQ